MRSCASGGIGTTTVEVLGNKAGGSEVSLEDNILSILKNGPILIFNGESVNNAFLIHTKKS